ncbi:hypothetical protein [Paraburkholderia saeva]|uniref:hypothetical protein n=1 Tax=Paraburkholderia saeva TaxID=2777537 RepID=UPI001D3C9F42|nr:hypothetical protein [Paraburkholderia saeva]CAG4911685.1 hypothetical protein R52603_03951 [Paraburkholderia saeva]
MLIADVTALEEQTEITEMLNHRTWRGTASQNVTRFQMPPNCGRILGVGLAKYIAMDFATAPLIDELFT